jgi:prephenate dehydrogenase
MKKIKKIAIIGVGFMGGSLAIALKKTFPRIKVSGYARSSKSYSRLKGLRITNEVSRDIKEVVSNADIIVLALPIYAIVDAFKKIKSSLKKGAIVIDLGSTKKVIEDKAKKILPKGVRFVGCHPLCGSEKSGAQYSQKGLYENALCVITSSSKNSALTTVKSLWKKLGSRTVVMSPSKHDELVSTISHLPHCISFSLVQTVSKKSMKYVGGSYKDLTRISDSPAGVWADIFLSNKKNVLGDIKKFIVEIKKCVSLIEKGNKKKLTSWIESANKKHQLMPKNSCER